MPCADYRAISRTNRSEISPLAVSFPARRGGGDRPSNTAVVYALAYSEGRAAMFNANSGPTSPRALAYDDAGSHGISGSYL